MFCFQFQLAPLFIGRLGGGAASEAVMRAGFTRLVYLIVAQLMVAVGMAILVGRCRLTE
jgi:hypothetical protein